jgi:hypothetical protein
MRFPTRRRLQLALLVTWWPLVAAGQASAQANDPPPATLTLDRMDGASRFGIQVGFDKLDQVDIDDGFFMRFEPHVQYVVPGRGAGFYAQVPITHVFVSSGTDTTAMGNLDVGGFFLPLGGPAAILRAGLVLPTAPASGDGMFANMITAYERMTDLMDVAPNYTALRLSASTLQSADALFFRGDVGIDFAVDKPTGARGTFLRANAAVGARAPGVDFSLELVNLGYLDGGGSYSRRFRHNLAFALRSRGANQVYAGMVFPLDGDARGEIWIMSAGYQFVTY